MLCRTQEGRSHLEHGSITVSLARTCWSSVGPLPTFAGVQGMCSAQKVTRRAQEEQGRVRAASSSHRPEKAPRFLNPVAWGPRNVPAEGRKQ